MAPVEARTQTEQEGLSANTKWFAVNTKPKNEGFAASQLKAKGLEIFLPRIEVIRKKGLTKIATSEPLFPGYLFVKIAPAAESVAKVNWTPGVRRLLCCGDTPVPVPQELITLIQQRVGPRDSGMPAIKKDFPRGTQVAVRYGSFAGLLGVVDKPMSGKGRVRVLLQCLHQVIPTEFDAVDLDRVSLAMPNA